MGKQYATLSEEDIAFIQAQHIGFIASHSGQEANLSPKGLDSFRVESAGSLLFLDYPGSGNRTARDVVAGGEVTVMFCAFEGSPKILRLFCKGELIGPCDEGFDDALSRFGAIDAGSVRQMIRLKIYAVESSCGFGVPILTYQGDRSALTDWVAKKQQAGKLERYIRDHATPPDLDGFRTKAD